MRHVPQCHVGTRFCDRVIRSSLIKKAPRVDVCSTYLSPNLKSPVAGQNAASNNDQSPTGHVETAYALVLVESIRVVVMAAVAIAVIDIVKTAVL
jgi:hypothetical protein